MTPQRRPTSVPTAYPYPLRLMVVLGALPTMYLGRLPAVLVPNYRAILSGLPLPHLRITKPPCLMKLRWSFTSERVVPIPLSLNRLPSGMLNRQPRAVPTSILSPLLAFVPQLALIASNGIGRQPSLSAIVQGLPLKPLALKRVILLLQHRLKITPFFSRGQEGN